MAGTKTIINSTGLDCLKELIKRQLAVDLDWDFLDVTFTRVQFNENQAIITAKTSMPDGRLPQYIGEVPFNYVTLSLDSFLPHDLTYGGVYPITFERLQNYFRISYDVLFEEGDLALVRPGLSDLPLTASTVISVDPDEFNRIQFKTLPTSKRFSQNGSFYLTITNPAIGNWEPLALSPATVGNGVAGEPYTIQYAVTGGVGPYTLQVIDGTPPVAFSPELMRMQGILLNSGAHTWTMQLTDARGISVERVYTMDVAVAPLTITGSAPDAQCSKTYSYQYEIKGGVPPYTLQQVSGLVDGLTLSNTGLLSGLPEMGNVNLTARFVDSRGVSVDLADSFIISARPTLEIAQSIYNKLISWYEFNEGLFTTTSVILDKHGSAHMAMVGNGQTVNGSRVGALSLDGNAYARAGVSQHNLDGNLGIVFVGRIGADQSGRHILSRLSDAAGWSLSVSVNNPQMFVLDAIIEGTPYTITSNPGEAQFDGNTWAMYDVWRRGNTVGFYRNTQKIGMKPIGTGPLSTHTDFPTCLGVKSNAQSSTKIDADFDLMLIMDDKLWSDEREYLYNAGNYRSYYRLKLDSGNIASPAPTLTLSGDLPDAAIDTPYGAALNITGGTGTHTNPRDVSGNLPDGIGLQIANGTLYVNGTFEQTGTVNMRLAVDGSDGQTAWLDQSIAVALEAPVSGILTGNTAWRFTLDSQDKKQSYDPVVSYKENGGALFVVPTGTMSDGRIATNTVVKIGDVNGTTLTTATVNAGFVPEQGTLGGTLLAVSEYRKGVVLLNGVLSYVEFSPSWVGTKRNLLRYPNATTNPISTASPAYKQCAIGLGGDYFYIFERLANRILRFPLVTGTGNSTTVADRVASGVMPNNSDYSCLNLNILPDGRVAVVWGDPVNNTRKVKIFSQDLVMQSDVSVPAILDLNTTSNPACVAMDNLGNLALVRAMVSNGYKVIEARHLDGFALYGPQGGTYGSGKQLIIGDQNVTPVRLLGGNGYVYLAVNSGSTGSASPPALQYFTLAA